MTVRDQNIRRERSFFGRRKGHKLRPHQAGLIERLLPALALDPGQPPPQLLRDLFADKIDDVRLEIGFGGGEHLLADLRADPRTGFIGCEPYLNGIAKLLSRFAEAPTGNLRLFAGDAAELLPWMPSASLCRIDLIHPDPWPKRRHWKRRFVQDATIRAMARVLVDNGEFRFASDIDDYCTWTLEHFARSAEFCWTAEHAADWREPWPNFTRTRYGAKAKREGRTTTYLRFRKQRAPIPVTAADALSRTSRRAVPSQATAARS